MRRRPFVVASMLSVLVTCHLPLVTTEAGQVEYEGDLPIVHLTGTPYELGRQHGELLREQVRGSVTQVLGYFRHYLKVPWVGQWVVNWWLDHAWTQATPFIPAAYLQELRGLADGSGVPLEDLYRLHAIPDRTYSCSNFAAWGSATKDGRLIHGRNLDWNIDAGIQQFATVFVVRPTGKRAFVSLGWAGFVGVLTGINDAQLSVGQIGAETIDATFRGEPMVFVIRRLLEESDSLETAARVVEEARRTVGINYVIADAKTKQALALETTHRHNRIFSADAPAEHAVSYARPMPDAVVRADTAMDPIIRNQQIASKGNPHRPGLEDPRGSSAYDRRYLGQVEDLQAQFGQLTPETTRAILQKVAPSSNVQSVIFAWPDLWVANAQATTPAASTPYHYFNIEILLQYTANQ